MVTLTSPAVEQLLSSLDGQNIHAGQAVPTHIQSAREYLQKNFDILPAIGINTTDPNPQSGQYCLVSTAVKTDPNNLFGIHTLRVETSVNYREGGKKKPCLMLCFLDDQFAFLPLARQVQVLLAKELPPHHDLIKHQSVFAVGSGSWHLASQGNGPRQLDLTGCSDFGPTPSSVLLALADTVPLAADVYAGLAQRGQKPTTSDIDNALKGFGRNLHIATTKTIGDDKKESIPLNTAGFVEAALNPHQYPLLLSYLTAQSDHKISGDMYTRSLTLAWNCIQTNRHVTQPRFTGYENVSLYLTHRIDTDQPEKLDMEKRTLSTAFPKLKLELKSNTDEFFDRGRYALVGPYSYNNSSIKDVASTLELVLIKPWEGMGKLESIINYMREKKKRVSGFFYAGGSFALQTGTLFFDSSSFSHGAAPMGILASFAPQLKLRFPTTKKIVFGVITEASTDSDSVMCRESIEREDSPQPGNEPLLFDRGVYVNKPMSLSSHSHQGFARAAELAAPYPRAAAPDPIVLVCQKSGLGRA